MKRSLLFSLMMALLSLVGVQRVCAQDWKGVSPATAASATSDDEKTVYLWNVSKKCFLEKGGRWGTEAVLGTTTNGQAFTVVAFNNNTNTYRLKAAITAEGGAADAYLTFMGASLNTVNATDNLNYYVDQSTDKYSYFTFTAVDGGYTLANNSYYLCAGYNSSSSSDASNSEYAINAFTSSNAKNNVWLLVTKKQRDEYFLESTKNGAADAGASYLVDDYSFARKDTKVNSWKITVDDEEQSLMNGSYSNGNWKLTPNDYSKTWYKYYGYHTYSVSGSRYDQACNMTIFTTENKDSSYSYRHNHEGAYSNPYTTTMELQSTINGYTYYVGNGLADGSDQLADGGKWTANIHGASGKVYQTITVPMAGNYRIKCKGFTTVAGKAKLFATSGEVTAENELTASTLDVTSVSYVEAWTELQKDGYAVVVTVKAAESGTITFGVEVVDGNADGWACFDDFELEYVGKADVFVILDENKESIDYLQTQNDNSDVQNGKVTVYLHRSFTANKWNTIVLPFDLSGSNLTDAFGSGVQLSKFVGATDKDHPTRLYFEKAESIEKDQLYLITPTKAEPTEQGEVTATADNTLTLEGKYYTISGVSFYEKDRKYTATVGGTDKGKEIYTGETQLQFVGTYVKEVNQIPVNSYMLYAGSEDTEGSLGYWVYRTNKSSSRAFRGWLQPVTTTAAKPVTFYINGIEAGGSETTAIEDALINTDSYSVSGNIYNLNGQMLRQNATSTEGLAKGVYIVGGKKVVVR